MVEKSRNAKIKLIVGIIGVLIIFSVLLYYLPSLNTTTSNVTAPQKVVDASTVDKYFGGTWTENVSESGFVKVNGSNGTIYFSNGTVDEIYLSNLDLISKNVSKIMGIIEADLDSINFTTFYQENQTISIIILNYSNSYEPQSVFDEAYKGLSFLNLTNITSSSFEIKYQNLQIGLGYEGHDMYLIFYQGNLNVYPKISDLMKYLL
ncbi:hypothetical protein DFR86_03525 [Acidianus sulfidivorans JP7]|uniref:Uncharacterized protein n=1 Tax=Acidianus sulfidivorans JP7 TaxID=619593 RepID=A0A2U9IL20_9CREN|nr:hypothetical protein [Acidianus sulfidivorans]AWR96717.1 hypothetical protein DFR86_03525 [Acidianus sulfidivorans JP7]